MATPRRRPSPRAPARRRCERCAPIRKRRAQFAPCTCNGRSSGTGRRPNKACARAIKLLPSSPSRTSCWATPPALAALAFMPTRRARRHRRAHAGLFVRSADEACAVVTGRISGTGDYPEALEAVASSRSVSTGSSGSATWKRGQALRQLGQLDRALEALTTAGRFDQTARRCRSAGTGWRARCSGQARGLHAETDKGDEMSRRMRWRSSRRPR